MQRVDHVNVSVRDLDEALRFYRDRLGLELVRAPDDFHGDHAMFHAGETTYTLMETGRGHFWDPADLDHPLDKAHVAIEADRETYDAACDRLDGQFPKQGPYDWGEFEGFYFLDPSGNLLEVVTRDPPVDGSDRTLLTHDDVE
jgi:catechol 2,3-dioxygenase-like lactoylglutathione lyase family enzyme